MATVTVGNPPLSGPKACPFYYLRDDQGEGFVKMGEVIRNLAGDELEQLERTHLDNPVVRDGKVAVIIAEQKEEVSYLDYVALEVDGRIIVPRVSGDGAGALRSSDDHYLMLEKGEQVQLHFEVDPSVDISSVTLLTEGYYLPLYNISSALHSSEESKVPF